VHPENFAAMVIYGLILVGVLKFCCLLPIVL
jgi:hypothetical protein